MVMKAITRGLVTAALLLIPFVAGAQTVRTWVSTGGSDVNPCSRAFPCRNFFAAITAVSPGGEVVVLDSGGFGAVSVNKNVSIISPPGIHAAIAPTVGNAITISSGSGVVVLRGLYLNSQGADTGVMVSAGDAVHLENMVVNGFDDGLFVASGTFLFVKDSLFREGALSGINVVSTLGEARLTIDNSRLEHNDLGIRARDDSRILIRDSVIAGNTTGVSATATGPATAEVTIESSAISNNEDAAVIVDAFGIVSVSASAISGNGTGLSSNTDDATIRVSSTTITRNSTGVTASNSGNIISFLNNRLSGNSTDGAFTANEGLQ